MKVLRLSGTAAYHRKAQGEGVRIREDEDEGLGSRQWEGSKVEGTHRYRYEAILFVYKKVH